jgi:hypothetical protein
MPSPITREPELSLPLLLCVTAADEVANEAVEAAAAQASLIDDASRAPNRLAERAIDNRLRRSISARAAAASLVAAVAPPVSASIGTRSGSDARAWDELERESISSALRDWVDLNEAQRYADRPSQLLRAVSDHEYRPISAEFEASLDPSLLEDERVLDAAAVLYRQVRRAQPSNRDGADIPQPLAELRSAFLVALRDDYAKERVLSALASPMGDPMLKTPFFDGFALRHAQHKTFDELTALPGMSMDPAFAALPSEEKRRWLEEKFSQMGESNQYAIGTPEHSLATAWLRIQSHRGMPISTQFDSRAALIEAFRELEEDWAEKPFYPYQPRLLFAAHLARSDGIELMSPDDLLLVYENRVADAAKIEAIDKGNDAPLEWIGLYLSERASRWMSQDKSERAQTILSLFAALRDAADGDGPVATFARELRDKGVLSDKRIIGDQTTRLDALTTYGNERLLSVFGTPPRFERYAAAAEILRSRGLSQDKIDELRTYVISGDNPNVTKTAYGDRVDEFLDRADWSGLIGSRMTLGVGVQIEPRHELQQAEERFNAELRSNPWIIARAKENLWTKDVRPTQAALDAEINRIAIDLEAETESHRARVRGFETWINMQPVAGPIYNIEEGIRHHDASRAAFGLFFLGVDLLDVAGTGGGRSGPSGRAHPVVSRMGRAASRLDASSVDIAMHPMMAEAAADPVDIAVQDGDIPRVHRGMAQRVRSGERKVRWRDYDVEHFEDENRIVLLAKESNVGIEMDWLSGHRLRTRSPLERDPLTGKLSPQETSFSVSSGETTIRGTEVDARLTVKTVKEILKDANRAELRDFDEIFGERFTHKSGSDASTFDAKAFFRGLYKQSRTFRRLVNRFEDVEARGRNRTRGPTKPWEFLVGEVGPLGAPTKAYTDFEHRRIYMPADETIEAMQYMSATGVQPMPREQAYLHEMIHALTGARDPERMLDMLNRGPVVYLTDKVLGEGGYAMAERVMYRRENSTDDAPRHDTIEYQRNNATEAAHAENRYLDPWVDGKHSVPKDTLVDGTPIDSRITVRDAKDIVRGVAGEDDDVFLFVDEFDSKFGRHFGFFASEHTPAEVAAADAKTLTDFYRRLYRNSPTFRYLFDGMPALDVRAEVPAWKFMIDKRPPDDALAQGASLQQPLGRVQEIHLLEPGLRYLSSAGLRDVEFERKLTYDVVQAMGGFGRLAPGETYRNRGAAVYLTDTILNEAGFHYPEQLVAALASTGDTAAEQRLFAYQTSAQRGVAVEDAYMRQD